MRQRNNDSRSSAFGLSSRTLLVAGFLVLILLAIQWFNWPHGDLEGVAFSQPYELNNAVLQTATPTATVTLTPTATPTATIPLGRNSLTARVYLDYRCDRFFQTGVDIPLKGASVTLTVNSGQRVAQAGPFGLVYFSGFDASGGVNVSVTLPASYMGYALTNCPGSSVSIDLDPEDFQFRYKFVQFRADVAGETAGP